MTKRTIDFVTDPRYVRRAREQKTIEAMLRMYCRGHRHPAAPGALCADCTLLHGYAVRRLERCLFGDAKPACANCVVHCYRPDMRERVREVMRWSGPRMLWRHPVLAILHLLDGRRPAPRRPERRTRGEESVVRCKPD